jgi:hypothetical protein
MATTVNLGSGLLAGFAAAIISQPADTMLSKINKTKGLPGESTISRLVKIAGELGIRGSFTGLPTRLFMVGGLTSGQFAIYGDIKKALGMFTHLLVGESQADSTCRRNSWCRDCQVIDQQWMRCCFTNPSPRWKANAMYYRTS